MRTSMLLLSTAMLTAALATPASAAPPAPMEPGPPFTLPLCGSDTGITFAEEVLRAREHKNGLLTGTIKLRLTNQDNGRNVLVNASGPGSFLETVLENGNIVLQFRATGPSLLYAFPGEEGFFAAAGLPELFVTMGPFRQTVVLDGDTFDVLDVSFEVPNRIVDLCPVLAPPL